MSHLGIPTFNYIMKKCGRKPTECNCEKCQSQCRTPCLATPEDIQRLIDAGYKDRLAITSWFAGILMGVTNKSIEMVQAKIENGWCTFFHNGLCELHDKGLKPTEGKLSHHSIRLDNFNKKKSISWLVAKEWLPLQNVLKTMIE